MNRVFKYIYHRFIPNQKKWYPFVSVYYLTYECGFRCSYCSDGSGKPYYELKSAAVSGDEAISIIREIRKYTDIFSLTGGEPLNHPEFGKIIKEIGKFRFKDLMLTTNGYELDKFLPEIAESVDTLIISLDTLNSEKADRTYDMPSGTLKQILRNIDKAKNYPNKKYNILISTVVTPENITDLYDLHEYVKLNDFQFAACPQLKGVRVHESLVGNKEYQNFFDFLIKEKSNNKNIFGSKKYLQFMRDLKNFDCTPFTMLVVAPNGDIYYPCLEIGHLSSNILDIQNLHEAKSQGFNNFGAQPKCGNQCHSACALSFSLLLGKA